MRYQRLLFLVLLTALFSCQEAPREPRVQWLQRGVEFSRVITYDPVDRSRVQLRMIDALCKADEIKLATEVAEEMTTWQRGQGWVRMARWHHDRKDPQSRDRLLEKTAHWIGSGLEGEARNLLSRDYIVACNDMDIKSALQQVQPGDIDEVDAEFSVEASTVQQWAEFETCDQLLERIGKLPHMNVTSRQLEMVRAYVDLAAFYQGQGRTEEAARVVQACRGTIDTFAFTHRFFFQAELARELKERGQEEMARQLLEEIHAGYMELAALPGIVGAQNAVGYAKLCLDGGWLEPVPEFLERAATGLQQAAIDLEPPMDRHIVRLLLADCHRRLGDTEQYLALLKESLEACPLAGSLRVKAAMAAELCIQVSRAPELIPADFTEAVEALLAQLTQDSKAQPFKKER